MFFFLGQGSVLFFLCFFDVFYVFFLRPWAGRFAQQILLLHSLGSPDLASAMTNLAGRKPGSAGRALASLGSADLASAGLWFLRPLARKIRPSQAVTALCIVFIFRRLRRASSFCDD